MAAFYFDGETARRHIVSLRISDSAIDIHEGEVWLASWKASEVRRLACEDVMRLTREGGPPLARLDVTDPDDVAAIRLHCRMLDIGNRSERTSRIVAWSLAATVSIILTVIYLMPLLAERLTPLIPRSVEQHLGDAVDGQIRTIFTKGACKGPDGQLALKKLMGRLRAAGHIQSALSVEVLDSRITNAIALPGGRIYLFDGLLNRAVSVDEIAGVLAHEIGHVENRDGLRKLIQAGGTSYLLGLLFGDVTGGGSIILVARYLVDSAYSREAERGADLHASRIMTGLGRPSHPMAMLLQRVEEKATTSIPPLLSSHPLTAERLATLERQRPEHIGEPLLNEQEWRALKEICMTS